MDYKNDPIIEDINSSSPYQTFNGEFYIMLLFVLFIFGLGFLAGNIAHDKLFHVIEQLHYSQ